MTAVPVRVSPGWLSLREPADSAARSDDLVGALLQVLPGGQPLRVHDLACGTGSLGRWLAPLLPHEQHWVLHDLDPDLLEIADREVAMSSASGGAVTMETRCEDVTRLLADAMAGASLITTSALLDLLARDELERLVASCVAAGCPVLLTISVVGQVDLTPVDTLDATVGAAFDAHQRRASQGRTLLGPDAVTTAVDLLTLQGMAVRVAPSPWRLDARRPALLAEWFAGWVGAAREARPELGADLDAYAARRAAQLASGDLRVTVHHLDVLAVPR
jgi:hypothetical protein